MKGLQCTQDERIDGRTMHGIFTSPSPPPRRVWRGGQNCSRCCLTSQVRVFNFQSVAERGHSLRGIVFLFVFCFGRLRREQKCMQQA